MIKALLFQIVKQILVNLWHSFLWEVVFGQWEHRSPCDTQLPFGMLFITMFYTCLVTEVVYNGGGGGGGTAL